MQARAARRARRHQLPGMRVLGSNRRAAGAESPVRAGAERPLSGLDAAIAEADRRRAAAGRDSPAWRPKDERRRSIPGLGPVSSLTRRAAGPESGPRAGRRRAARGGPAPFAEDSGPRRGGRHGRGGRATGRRVLDRAARSALRSPPVLKAFRDRRAARGKKARAILRAVAPKSLGIADAVIRTQRPWEPERAMAR